MTVAARMARARARARARVMSESDEDVPVDDGEWRTPDAKRRIRVKLTHNVTMYRAVRCRARARPDEALERAMTLAAVAGAGGATARAASSSDVSAMGSVPVRFRTTQGPWRMREMPRLPPETASPAELRARLTQYRMQLAAAQHEIERLKGEVPSEQQCAADLSAVSFRSAMMAAAASSDATEVALLRREVVELRAAAAALPCSEIASSDGNMRGPVTPRYTWLYRQRFAAEKPLLQNLENLHGGREGFEWRIIRLVRSLGVVFWMKLLMTEFFRKFTMSTINRQAERKVSLQDKIKSLVSRERLVGVSVRAWERVSAARERSSSMQTALGPVRMVRRLLSSYFDESAKYYIWNQSWCPKSYAGPELAVKYATMLGPELAAELSSCRIMMKDLSEYLACIVKLLVEVDELREKLIWFVDSASEVKVCHFELGLEGDGFPPDAFEMLIHPFNVHRYAEHMDLHFTVLAGTISEKSALLKALMRIIDDQWKKIVADGLDVILGPEVKKGSFIGCQGPGSHHFTFGGTGKGDLSWFGTAAAAGTNSHTFCEISHDLNLKARPVIDATILDHPRLTVERRIAQSASAEKAREEAAARVRLTEEFPESDEAKERISSAGAAAAKAAAEGEGHSQYNGTPLEMFLSSVQHDGMHLHCGLMQTALDNQLVNCLDDDGHVDRVDDESIDIKNATTHLGPSMTTLVEMVDRDMKLSRIATNIRDMYSSDAQKRADAKKARLNGLAARKMSSDRWRLDDLNGPPDATWRSVKRGAETLSIMLIASYMTWCMRHRMTRAELDLLTTVGGHIFALMAIFVVGSHRRRQIGLKEHVLCYFLPWCLHETFERFRYCDRKGNPTGFSLGGGVIGSMQSGGRHHGETKKRMKILGCDL